MLTTRQIELLKYLEKREEYTTTKELAKEFSISSRTIRNNLDAIEYSTKNLPIRIERTPRLGIRLEFLEKVGLDSILYTNDMKEYSRDERSIVIAMILILTDKTTIEQLAEQMEVSKNTLVEDLNSVEALFEYYGITLERKSYYGLTISGDEEKIRNMVFNIYLKITKQKTINLDEIIKEHAVIKEEIPMEIIYKIEENEKIKYSDDSVNELKNMILVTLNRAYYGFYIGGGAGYLRGREKPDNFKVIEDILKAEKIKATEGDILYMIMLLNASKKIKGISLEDTIEDRKIMMATQSLIQEFCRITKIDMKMGQDISTQIMMHLKVAIYRLKNHIEIENPLMEDIKYSSLFVYEITKKILKEYEAMFGVEFPEAEIAYTTMYFETLFQENYDMNFTVNVIVVCNSGLSTAVLLKQRLHMIIPELNVISTCRVSDVIKEAENIEPDFIISTVPLKMDQYKVIEVNPLLNAEDVNVIRRNLTNLSYNRRSEHLAKQMEALHKMSMEELFQKDCCQFDLPISDWKEAIQVAADPLIQYNYIQKEYVDDIIKIVQTIGNYMVFIPEIAFVHAPPEHVNEDHMSLLKLEKPIEFGAKSKVDVKVIIVIASKEENKNLVELMQILMKEDNVAKLKNVTNYDDIREIR